MKTVIEVEFRSPDIAAAAQKTLQVEAGPQRRSMSKIARIGKKIKIIITAQDIAALHAATSSFMRALKVFTAVAAHKV